MCIVFIAGQHNLETGYLHGKHSRANIDNNNFTNQNITLFETVILWIKCRMKEYFFFTQYVNESWSPSPSQATLSHVAMTVWLDLNAEP